MPTYVVRCARSMTVDRYIQKDGSWGDYKTARVFKTQDACITRAEGLALGNYYGIFPRSSGRK